MRNRQRGATFVGMVADPAHPGRRLYAGDAARCPVYLEYMKVARALEQVRDEHAANEPTRG